MKVAVVVSKFPVISETFVLNHITSLLDAGMQVKVLAFEQTQNQPQHPQYVEYQLQKATTAGQKAPLAKGIRIINFLKILWREFLSKRRTGILKTLNPLQLGKEALSLELFYKAQITKGDHHFDIIHCHFGPVAHDVEKLRKLGLISGKLVVSFHGYDFLKKDILKKYNNYKVLFKSCDGVVANSYFTKNRLVALGCNENKIEILPALPNPNIINVDEKRVKDKEVFKILTVARLEEVKGIQYGIEAVALLKNTYGIPVQYNIVGGGSQYNELKVLIEKENLGKVIILHGAQTQDMVAAFYQDADVFLLTSVMETQGLVLLEAQTNGLPVVASRVGGIPDSLIENETGLLVESKDVSAFSKALFKLYQFPNVRIAFGEKGKTFVREKFDAKTIAGKMIAFYLKLINSKL